MADDISDLKGIGDTTAKRLPVDTIEELANADPDELDVDGVSEERAAEWINRANEETVIIQTGDQVKEEYDSKSLIGTGSDTLDDMIGGGWQEGDIVLIAGKSGTGKTQIVFQSLVNAVEETGRPAVYIETERNRYSPERIDQLATKEDTQSKIYRVKAYGLDKQRSAFGKVQQEFGPGDLSLLAVDSFTARFRLSERFENRGTLQDRSKTMGNHLERLESAVSTLEVPALITGQVYGSPSQYENTRVYGGTLFAHTVAYMLKTSESSGEAVNIDLLNNPGKPDRSEEFVITHAGIQRA